MPILTAVLLTDGGPPSPDHDGARTIRYVSSRSLGDADSIVVATQLHRPASRCVAVQKSSSSAKMQLLNIVPEKEWQETQLETSLIDSLLPLDTPLKKELLLGAHGNRI